MIATCRRCQRSLDPYEAREGVHWSCAREAANRAADYGPHVRVGARCLNGRSQEVGRVLRIEDGCHWGRLNPYDDLWRPRSAYVLRDGDRPMRGELVPDGAYWAPDDLVVVPEHWTSGAGVFGGASDRPARRVTPWAPTVVRPLSTARGTEWHLMNRQDRGFAERSYGYATWSELLDAWAVVIGEPGQDQHGVFVRVTPEPVPAECVAA